MRYKDINHLFDSLHFLRSIFQCQFQKTISRHSQLHAHVPKRRSHGQHLLGTDSRYIYQTYYWSGLHEFLDIGDFLAFPICNNGLWLHPNLTALPMLVLTHIDAMLSVPRSRFDSTRFKMVSRLSANCSRDIETFPKGT